MGCNNFAFIFRIVGYLFGILEFVVPIIIIVVVTIDIIKAMISKDEKDVKEATSKAVKRIIYAIIIFLVPVIIKYAFKTIANFTKNDKSGLDNPTSWVACFDEFFK